MMMERNAGLDAIRTLAIGLVLLSHGAYVFTSSCASLRSSLWKMEVFGYLGVEVFFVLSGFLIGAILLRLFTNARCTPLPTLLGNFYLRRWYRTLPLYYLMLAVNVFFWEWAAGWQWFSVGHVSWQYVLFLQNYYLAPGVFFPESWSLAVEEWFYLLFPVGMAMAVRRGGEKRLDILILTFVFCVLAVRIFYVHWELVEFDSGVRKNIFLRLDSLAIGVLLAYIALWMPERLRRIASWWRLAVFFLAGVCGYFWLVGWSGWNQSFFARTFMLSLVSISCAVLVAKAYLHVGLTGGVRSFFYWMSTLSYAMYLVHLPVFVTTMFFLQGVASVVAALGALVVDLCLIVAFSYVLHRFFERPLMRLRPQEIREEAASCPKGL